MRSLIVVLSIVLLLGVSVEAFGGCGCGQDYEEPSPCEQEQQEQQEPKSSCKSKGCPVCESADIPEPCPVCESSEQPECGPCPVPKRPPPCEVCKAPKPCEVCKACPAPEKPKPCPTCPAHPPPKKCPVCPAPEPQEEPQCPPPPPPPSPSSSCSGGGRQSPAPRPHYGNDCCNDCGQSCFVRRRALALGAATLVVDVDPTCNSEKLRHIILKNIAGSTSESKRAIQKEAIEKLSAQFDVVCGQGEFAYVISSNQFCQETKDNITCYAFRRQ